MALSTRLGEIDSSCSLPVYHALEKGFLDFKGRLIKAPPTKLNRMLLTGELDATPFSSIEYARNPGRSVILPDISISADGRTDSVLLFSKYPVTELEGKSLAVTTASATSAVLLRILLDHYFHVSAEFCPHHPDHKEMLGENDGALLTGDDALLARQAVINEGLELIITDLGDAWNKFTGESMVYTLWVVREDYARDNPAEVDSLSKLLVESKKLGLSDLTPVLKKAHKRSGLPPAVLKDYFNNISYDFGQDDRRSLLLFYDYAYKSGVIDHRPKLKVWGESCNP